MKTSEQINELAAALAQAQDEFNPVKKSGINPHLKSRYATLDDVLNAVSQALARNGLALVQMLDEGDLLTTTLMHASGQWIASACAVPSMDGNRGVNQLQAFGGALTYMRRYALTALLGVSSDSDDDAISASDETRQPRRGEQMRQRAKGNGKRASLTRPMDAATLRVALHKKAAGRGADVSATEKQIPFVARKFEECFADNPNPKSDYHAALEWLFGVNGVKKLTKAQAGALLDWLLDKDGADDTGDVPLHEHAPEEARRVLRQVIKDAGQADMFEEAEEIPY